MLNDIRNLIFSKTAKDSLVIFWGNGVSAILAIIITIIVARTLGPEGWGIAAAVLGFITILSALADLGFGSGLFRFASKNFHLGKTMKAEKILTIVFLLRMVTALSLSFALIIFSSFVTNFFFKNQDEALSLLGALGLLGGLLVDFQIAVFQARQSFKIAAIFITLTNCIRLILILLLFNFDQLNLFNLLLVYFSSSIFTFLISLLWQPVNLRWGNDWKDILKDILSFSGWMGINRVFSVISSRVDILILLQLTTPVEAGIFAAAKQLSSGIPIILGSFATVLAPRFASLEGYKLKDFFKKTVLLSGIIGIGIMVGVLLAEPVISLLGPKYSGSTNVLRLLLISLVPFALSTPPVNFLIYSLNKPKIIALLSLVQLPLIILGNFYLIPRWGIIGPVIIYTLVNISTMFVTYFFSVRKLKV